MKSLINAFVLLLLFSTQVNAQDLSDAFDHWPSDLRIQGNVVLGAGSESINLIRETLSRRKLRGRVAVIVDNELSEEQVLEYANLAGKASDFSIHRRTPTDAINDLAEIAASCETLIWSSNAVLTRNQIMSLGAARESLIGILENGGTLVCLGPSAGVLGASQYVTGSGGESKSVPGLAIVPDCIFRFQSGEQAAFEETLRSTPENVGVQLAPGTLFTLSGRTVSVAGTGTATLMLAGTRQSPSRQSQTLSRHRSQRQPANEFLADLTQWRRRAMDQLLPPFPSGKPKTPCVENGTLVIVGGGGMPKDLMRDFVDLAGGVNEARLVYVPCSESLEVASDQYTVLQWRSMGVKHATMIHTKDRNKANTDEAFFAPLVHATGVWFGGGRQWNFADSYYGTKTHDLMQQVLDRGGVVGGSSAGASIQASFLARATPIQNVDILAPGYLRGGLGFISGVAIDQHFTQRGRQKDMSVLKQQFPQMLGIGIDESTALIVNKSIAEVVGGGDVYFYDRDEAPTDDDVSEYTKLGKGARYDLSTRSVIVEANLAD